jgi:hypothetical protein
VLPRAAVLPLAAAVVAIGAACGVGCGGGSRAHATMAVPMPHEVADRQVAMDEFGRRLHAALLAGRPIDVLLGDDEIRRVLTSENATRVAARRAAIGVRLGHTRQLASSLAHTEYLGVCLQDARDEANTGPIGLRNVGWTFRRVLLAAQRPGGRRVALWVDGLFVYTDNGFGALDLERVEDPRWEHADLELAPCDMSTALH